jgi:hypothetical protein
MAQQELDPPEIDACCQSVRGAGMTKHMRVDGLREVGSLPGVSAEERDRFGCHRARPGLAGKEPRARFLLLPILP